MDINRIHVNLSVDTRYAPKHWKTVASMTTFMLGRAVIRAAEDVTDQLKGMAAVALKCAPEDLGIEDGRVFLQSDPAVFLEF